MKDLDFGRYTLGSCVAVAMLAACGGSQPPIGATGAMAQAPDNKAQSKTFKFTGAAQTFVVPNNVTVITVTAYGASGGKDGTNYVMGGDGGVVKAVLPVTSGETLYVLVGGEGVNGYNGLAGSGGFNGGGAGGAGGYTNSSENGGNGGGGASDVRQGGSALADRVLVAGGGGGAGGAFFQGSNGSGGAGGGKIGGKGKGGNSPTDGAGGFGGTQMRGGKGGAGGAYTQGRGHAAHGKRGQLGSGVPAAAAKRGNSPVQGAAVLVVGSMAVAAEARQHSETPVAADHHTSSRARRF
ncbi:MAG TPA: glycine-rich protein [Candidatus Cybelea sp.]|jgi:hypothetical protein|nr:glycine-rich protein [Candidatus Cybelea sp.]